MDFRKTVTLSFVILSTAGAVLLLERPLASQPKQDGRLDSYFTVAGRVQTPDGQPAVNAVVRAFNPFTKQQVGRPVSVVADGGFEIRLEKAPFGVGANRHEAWRLASIVAEADGFAPTWAFAYQFTEEASSILRLGQDDITIHGRITDREGQSVEAAQVTPVRVWRPVSADLDAFLARYRQYPADPLGSLNKRTVEGFPETVNVRGQEEQRSRPILTDERGCFRIGGVGRERVVQLRITGAGLADSEILVVTRPEIESALYKGLDNETRAALRAKVERAQMYPTSFTHELKPGCSIHGTVRDRNTGTPLSGVKLDVRIRGPDYYYGLEADTNANGIYELRGIRKGAEARMQIQPAADQPYPQIRRVVNISTKRTMVDFDLTRGVFVRGTVTIAGTGEPIRCRVSYRASDKNPGLEALGDPLGSYFNILTDSHGRYSLCVLPGPGTLTVHAHAAPGSDVQIKTTPKPIHPVPGEDSEVDLVVNVLND